MDVRKIKKETWIRIGCTITAIVIVFLLASIKYEFNMDEIMSFSLSNNRGTGWVEYNAFDTVFTNSDFRGFMVTEFPFDFKNVIRLQAGDCHPPLFYFGIHFVSSLFPYTLNPLYGIVPNILYYVVTSILIYKIMDILFQNNKVSSIVSIIYLFSPPIIEGVLFIRMYTLVAMLSALLIYACLLIVNKGQIKKGLILLCVSTLLGTLSHYYFYIVLGLTVLYASIALLKNKEYKLLKQSAIVTLIGVVLSWMIYPYVFQNIVNSSHFKVAIENTMEMSYWSRLLAFYKVNFYGIWFIGLLIGALVWILGIKKVSFKEVNKQNLLLLPFVYLGYTIVVSITATYVTNRYIYPVAFLQVIIITFLYYKVFESLNINWKINFVILLAITVFFANYKMNVDPSKNTIAFAQDKKGAQAIVITDEQFNYNMSNTILFDLKNYETVYFAGINTTPSINLCDASEGIIYAWNTISEEEIVEWMNCDGSPQLRDMNMSNASYKIYEYVEQ